MTTLQQEKRYDPKDKTLILVDRDDLDPLPPEEGEKRVCAQMSCGHAFNPDSLTGWCSNLLSQGQYKFVCPALVKGTQKCNAQWSYTEVRKLALLTAEEMQHFEKTIALLADNQNSDYKTCPGCNTYVERKDLSNLSVRCTVCTADKKRTYEFCWQCLKEWKGSSRRSDHCDNDGCVSYNVEILQNCKTTSLPQVEGVECPSIRACPTCGQRTEHNTTGCKNIICPRCKVEFCFVCLKLKPECLKTSSHFKLCSDGVAPRQTSIPVWNKR